MPSTLGSSVACGAVTVRGVPVYDSIILVADKAALADVLVEKE